MRKDIYGKTSCAGHLLSEVLLKRAVDNVNEFGKLLKESGIISEVKKREEAS
jgi:hypothetical protein